MPRGPRLDAPGLFHHVMFRGVARAPIFHDDEDRRELLDRFDRVLPDAGTVCTSWALIPNHGHMKLGTGRVALGLVMQRVLGGYAAWFNEKYDRVGHLFQGRFLSKPILRDAHFRHLDGYVAGQALSAGLVADLDELARYPWSGYGALMGTMPARAFHDVELGLAHAGPNRGSARHNIQTATIAAARQKGVTVDGWSASVPRASSEILETDHASRAERGSARRRGQFIDARPLFDAMIEAACLVARIPRETLLSDARTRCVSTTRAVLAHAAVDRLGLSNGRTASALRITPQAVSIAVRRGRELRAGGDAGAREIFAAVDALVTRAGDNLLLEQRPRRSAA